MEANRKIVQIALQQRDPKDPYSSTVIYALCDDGSVWHEMIERSSGKVVSTGWRRVGTQTLEFAP